MSNFKLNELFEILSIETKLFISNDFGFRQLAYAEMKKVNRRNLIALAQALVCDVSEESFKRWGKAGIRAQLFNTKTNNLEMDFCFEGDDRSFHVLNAVSPAFTCALPFSRLLVDEIGKIINIDVK